MVPFNKPYLSGNELQYIKDAINRGHLSGDGHYTKKCQLWLEEMIGSKKALLTHSCTAALELAAILADIGPGDEVIMPSYTFVSTANAFVLRGGVPVFVDIRPDTMNIDESLIESAITDKTKAIVPIHYAGVSCAMQKIMRIAHKYDLLVIEDAAQAIMSYSDGTALGSIGHLGTLSFHETKNITAGEGGALLINDQRFIERAEIVREKGTNRSKFFRGEIDKYTWVDIGSSYLPSDINAAFLYAQMENAESITRQRLKIWNHYYTSLKPLMDRGLIELPFVPPGCVHNAHMFYIKTEDLAQRARVIDYLREKNYYSVFHYIPLHTSALGRSCSRFHGQDINTTRESERLLRLPLFYELSLETVSQIVREIKDFYK